jgi:hypothetical protein
MVNIVKASPTSAVFLQTVKVNGLKFRIQDANVAIAEIDFGIGVSIATKADS